MEASAAFEERPAAGIVVAGGIFVADIADIAAAGIVPVAGTLAGEPSEVGALGHPERLSGLGSRSRRSTSPSSRNRSTGTRAACSCSQSSTEKKQEAAITMMATPKPSIRKADSLELVSTYLSWILTGVVGLIPDGTPISSPFLKPLESTRTQLEMRVLPLYR